MRARTVEGAHGPCEGDTDRPRLCWAWPVSWAFLCGAAASGALTWPERWRAHVFILWFLADPFTGILAQGVRAIRWGWQKALDEDPPQRIVWLPFMQAESPAERLGAFCRALFLAWDGPGRALWWSILACVAVFLFMSRQGGEMWRLLPFLAGSALCVAAWERSPSLPLTTGLRAAWAWSLGHWAFAPLSPLRYGLAILAGAGLAAALWEKGAVPSGAKWLGRLAAWLLTLGFLGASQPFLAAMAAGVGLNWEALSLPNDQRSPHAVWRLAWLGLVMMASIVVSAGAAL